MALTATFATGGDFETAEEGRYVCQIADVKAEDRPSYDDKNVLEPTFVWTFETAKEADSNGRPFKFFAYTKTRYVAGNDKAKLTLLIDGLFGRSFVKEQVEQIDFEKLIGKTCAVMVGVTPTGKNKVLSVRGMKNNPINYEDVLVDGADKRVSPPAADDIDDPFADD